MSIENVILYTTDCPKCNVLKAKLDAANIAYTVVRDIDVMMQKGLMSAPNLEVNGKIMDFSTAIKWVNERG